MPLHCVDELRIALGGPGGSGVPHRPYQRASNLDAKAKSMAAANVPLAIATVPDLIVHRVGKREDLLVIEVKKVTNNDYGVTSGN